MGWEQDENGNVKTPSATNNTSNNGVVSTGTSALIFSIIGFLICGILAIPGLIMAGKNTDPLQAGNATAAKILSIITIVLWAVGLIFIVLFFVIFATAASSIY